MPRPRKCRKVCSLPENKEFLPLNSKEKRAGIIMTVDEYETLRLIDKEGFSQEECGKYMKIARTTVQQVYNSARKKTACALVDGLPLKIDGGEYCLCSGEEADCDCGGCEKHRRRCRKKKTGKGANMVKVAVTYENGLVFQHFGHTKQFKFYEIEDGKLTHSEIVDTNGSGHGALAGFLSAQGTDILICGGIGGGAQAALAQAGIRLFGGVSGDPDEAVRAFLDGKLEFQPDVHCDHHEHGHGDQGCGEHSCGSHK